MDAPLYDPEHDAKIVSWRESCFQRLGFNVLQARVLAMRRDIDRQDVANLRARGCQAHVVMGIVL